MSYTDAEFLEIEAYSDHPEVYTVADVLTAAYFNEKERVRNPHLVIRDARKLVASMVLREDDLFRFTTKTSSFSSGNRKQVWMTRRVLKLFNTAVGLGWIDLVQKGIRPSPGKSGKAARYSRSSAFKELSVGIDVKDIVPDPDRLRVELRDAEGKQVELSDEVISCLLYTSDAADE